MSGYFLHIIMNDITISHLVDFEHIDFIMRTFSGVIVLSALSFGIASKFKLVRKQ